MLFYGSRKFRSGTIILGQYLGITTLVAIALIGSFVGNFLDPRYVGLLGLFPIYLGIKGFVAMRKHTETSEEINTAPNAAEFLSIAGVTIANGSDNIGVYIPLMSTMKQSEKIEMIIIFAIMTYLWCFTGKFLSSRPMIARQIDKFGHIIMPFVLLSLGIFILFESGSMTLINVF
jgi:cadmium resistance protein CadD (predicted permease)